MFEIAGGIIIAFIVICNFEAVFKFAYYGIVIAFFGALLIWGLDTFFRQPGEDQIVFLCICAVVVLFFYFHIKSENKKTAKELAKIHAEAVKYHQR